MSKTKRNTNPAGVCALCGETVAQRKAAPHLEKCRDAKPLPAATTKTAFYTLEVVAPGFPEFFLFVEIAGSKKLSTLDEFLRETWVECCGHLSSFTINGVVYDCNNDGAFQDDFPDNKNMDAKIKDVLDGQTEFAYEYDFGTPTDLALRVVRVRSAKEKAAATPVLLMRNIPPDWKCAKCGEPAVIVDAYGNGLAPENVYCAKCAKKAVEEEARSPILNSPRSGVCGYGRVYDDEPF